MSKLVIEQFIKHIESLVFQVLKVIPIGIGFGILTVIVMQVYEKISMLRGGASDTACGGSALLDTEGRISIWAHKGIRERIDKAGLYGSAQAGLGIQP